MLINEEHTAGIIAEIETLDMDHLNEHDRQILAAVKMTGNQIITDALPPPETANDPNADLKEATDAESRAQEAAMVEQELKPRRDRLDRKIAELEGLTNRATQ